jgi:superoxide dismutase, Fe-Mn family
MLCYDDGKRSYAMSETTMLPGFMNRRLFIYSATVLGAGLALGLHPLPARAAELTLPELPYALDALEPVISRRTLEFHYGKHHAAYVKNTNAALPGSGLEGKSLEEIVMASAEDKKLRSLFNNAAQVWNHTFYWRSLTPNGGGEPDGELRSSIESSFGTVSRCVELLAKAATGRFGSGWAWLVQDGEKLRVTATSNAGTPMTRGHKPLLCIDVWEHAYYLDYQNRRGDYVQAVLAELLNWKSAAENLARTNT